MPHAVAQTPAGRTPRIEPQVPGSGVRGGSGAGPTTVPVNGPAVSMEVLQAQLIDLTQQIAGYRAQRVVIDRQIRIGNLDAQARAQMAVRRANLDVQIAQLDADLASVKAQIAARQGVPVERIGQTGTIMPPPVSRQRGVNAEMVVGMSFVLLASLVIPLSIAYARRLWRGKPEPAAPKTDELAPRLDRLEQAVGAIAIEIERISEGQRFVTRIMAERNGAAVAEGAPALALGAGPAEPVRVEGKEGVAVRR